MLVQVMKDFRCLYCNDRCLPFSSLEAVRKHMEAKSHCKVHYGDGDDNEEVELEEFYDYSSRCLFLYFLNLQVLIALARHGSSVELVFVFSGFGGTVMRMEVAISWYHQVLRPILLNLAVVELSSS